MQTLQYKNAGVFYSTFGHPENPAVMLLHGYLESMKIWEDMARELQNDFFVITPDIPGHGLSEVTGEIHTMEEMAEVIRMILEELSIQKIHLAGHSMGGYITLAFKELFPGRLSSYTLFHSHCFADSEEKKLNRDKEIELINSGKKKLIIRKFIPNLFADENAKKFSDEIKLLTLIAMNTPEQGIIAILKGLKNRKDRSHIVKMGGTPGLLVSGCHDNFIPKDLNDRIMDLSGELSRVDLKNSGHIGMIEEKKKAATELRNFFFSIRASQ